MKKALLSLCFAAVIACSFVFADGLAVTPPNVVGVGSDDGIDPTTGRPYWCNIRFGDGTLIQCDHGCSSRTPAGGCGSAWTLCDYAGGVCEDCACSVRTVYFVDDFNNQYTYTECACCVPVGPITGSQACRMPRYDVTPIVIDDDWVVIDP